MGDSNTAAPPGGHQVMPMPSLAPLESLAENPAAYSILVLVPAESPPADSTVCFLFK